MAIARLERRTGGLDLHCPARTGFVMRGGHGSRRFFAPARGGPRAVAIETTETLYIAGIDDACGSRSKFNFTCSRFAPSAQRSTAGADVARLASHILRRRYSKRGRNVVIAPAWFFESTRVPRRLYPEGNAPFRAHPASNFLESITMTWINRSDVVAIQRSRA